MGGCVEILRNIVSVGRSVIFCGVIGCSKNIARFEGLENLCFANIMINEFTAGCTVYALKYTRIAL